MYRHWLGGAEQATIHYSDVIMSAMAFQITGISIVCSTRLFRRRSKKTWKLRVTGLCEGNPPVTGGFPSQRANNEDFFPRRHHAIIRTNHDSVLWRIYAARGFNEVVSLQNNVYFVFGRHNVFIIECHMKWLKHVWVWPIEDEWRIYASVIKSSLVQITACCLVGAKPLSEPMLECC